MKSIEAKKLHPGDEVYWTDPDGDLCSRKYTIAEIEVSGFVVKITDKDGSYLECYAGELS